MPEHTSEPLLERQVTLLETLDRVLNRGVVVAGDVTMSVADVDLIHVGLRVLLCSVETAREWRGRGTHPLPYPCRQSTCTA